MYKQLYNMLSSIRHPMMKALKNGISNTEIIDIEMNFVMSSIRYFCSNYDLLKTHNNGE